ncbi:PAS domain S-box protein, partial [bacterium]|nr:PAS domain S-box protein [bacterium]
KNAEKNRILIPKLDKHLIRMKANSDSVYRTAMEKWIYCDNAKVSLLVYYIGVPGLILFLIVLAVHRRMRRNLNHQAREIKTQSKQLDIMLLKRFEAEKSNFWLFNTISDGLVVFNLGVDGIPGIITEVNKQTCLILGRDETKLKSMKIIELVDSSELERIPHLINQLRIRRDILFPIKLCSADGSTRNVEIHANLIDVDGQWRALSVIRDVTERINLEHEFIEKHKELQEQFEQRSIELQRMNQELEMFAGTVSHDLQSPLRTIESIVERVRIKCSNGDFDANEEINRMVFLIHRVNGLVTGILEYNRLTRWDLEMTNVELSQICSEVLLQLDGTIRDKNAEVIIERPMPCVIAHPNTLLRCIQNLLTNALKFVEYGKIPKVVLRAEHRGDVVRLWVIDNGIGIAPEYQDRIFQVFERLHGLEEYTGNGLGLAIVKRAVERMNGRFGLISKEGEGSRFWIELPVDPTDP